MCKPIFNIQCTQWSIFNVCINKIKKIASYDVIYNNNGSEKQVSTKVWNNRRILYVHIETDYKMPHFGWKLNNILKPIALKQLF